MSYPDQIAELLNQARVNLATKLAAAGRVIAPGAEIEYEYDTETNSFTLKVDSIPDPRLRRFVLHAGYVHSRSDGDRHFIPATRLVDLYELKPGEYLFWDSRESEGRKASDFRHLYPRSDGKYGRPRDE